MTQNRPIKFRAYLKDINKMVEVNEINWYENLDDKGNISSIRYAGETKYAHHYFEFDPNDVVLMQYTGYKDMKGKEIYEGDIVRYYDDIYEVKWMWAGFYIHSLQNGFDELATNENFVEVIGNIYENPELLNDEKEKA
jgi:uncharacterized phage protein (TIGR01671 family)